MARGRREHVPRTRPGATLRAATSEGGPGRSCRRGNNEAVATRLGCALRNHCPPGRPLCLARSRLEQSHGFGPVRVGAARVLHWRGLPLRAFGPGEGGGRTTAWWPTRTGRSFGPGEGGGRTLTGKGSEEQSVGDPLWSSSRPNKARVASKGRPLHPDYLLWGLVLAGSARPASSGERHGSRARRSEALRMPCAGALVASVRAGPCRLLSEATGALK